MSPGNDSPHVLATFAATRPDQLFGEVVLWLLVLLGAAVVGGIALYVVRRSLRGPETAPGEGFTLHDLRMLHASGDLTDEEYERARQAVIGRVRGAASGKPNDATETPSEPRSD